MVNPANVVGIGIADSLGLDTLNAYDSSMNLLETAAVISGLNVYQGFDRGSSFDITFFEILCDFCAIDDLLFNSAAVPEPSTLLLLGSGLAGLGLWRRMRKDRV